VGFSRAQPSLQTGNAASAAAAQQQPGATLYLQQQQKQLGRGQERVGAEVGRKRSALIAGAFHECRRHTHVVVGAIGKGGLLQGSFTWGGGGGVGMQEEWCASTVHLVPVVRVEV